VELPHDYVVEGTVDEILGDTSHGYLPIGIGWYRKHFVPPAERGGQLAFLDFEGAMGATEVYVNGIFVASKVAGYTPFRCVRARRSARLTTTHGGGGVEGARARIWCSSAAEWSSDGAGGGANDASETKRRLT
jgi:beta-galactosidase